MILIFENNVHVKLSSSSDNPWSRQGWSFAYRFLCSAQPWIILDLVKVHLLPILGPGMARLCFVQSRFVPARLWLRRGSSFAFALSSRSLSSTYHWPGQGSSFSFALSSQGWPSAHHWLSQGKLLIFIFAFSRQVKSSAHHWLSPRLIPCPCSTQLKLILCPSLTQSRFIHCPCSAKLRLIFYLCSTPAVTLLASVLSNQDLSSAHPWPKQDSSSAFALSSQRSSSVNHGFS